MVVGKALNGLFGMRISSGILPLDHIAPITHVFDTPGLLARSASLLKAAYNAWLPTTSSYSSYPKRIILPTEFWPPINATEEANATYTSFLSNLSTLLTLLHCQVAHHPLSCT